MPTLMDLLTGQQGDQTMQMIAQQLGTDEKTSRSAVETALPVLIAALNKNASKGGAQSLDNALAKDHDGSILDRLNDFIPNASQGPGNAILGHVLGNRLGMVEQFIGKENGLSTQDSGKLLQILAPMVLGALGKQKREKNLDSNGITDLLGGLVGQIGGQQSGGMQNKLFSALLDQDGDGDISDDLLNMGGKLLGGLFKGRS